MVFLILINKNQRAANVFPLCRSVMWLANGNMAAGRRLIFKELLQHTGMAIMD
jgi:hypothetical protein